MRKDICLLYIGYLTGYHYNDPVLLCVSDDKSKVKYYLKNVRKLDKKDYDIREAVLGYDSVLSLYEDYILKDFEEDCLFLTNRDIEYINKEIENIILQLEKSLKEFQTYCNMIRKVPGMEDTLNTLLHSEKIMEKQLSKVKTLRKICNSELRESPIFSANILEYLQSMEYLQEDQELTNLFYRKVYEDD